MVVKDQLLKKKLYGDIGNAEEQVFEEAVFLEERQKQTIDVNKGVVRQVEGIQNVNIMGIMEIRSGQDI